MGLQRRDSSTPFAILFGALLDAARINHLQRLSTRWLESPWSSPRREDPNRCTVTVQHRHPVLSSIDE